MADTDKYYYFKLKENYFEKDAVKILESLDNGHIYSLIILKLYLKCIRTNGQLMMTERIPYDPSKVDILANIIHHDPDHVRHAILCAKDLDIIEIFETGEIFMNDIQAFIGKSSTEAERKKLYRAQLEQKRLANGQMSGHCPPEIEIEKELKIEKEPQKRVYVKFKEPTLEEFTQYFLDNGFSSQLAERAYKGYDVANWHDAKGKKISSWKQKCQHVWFKDENKLKPQKQMREI